jgi:hypothetical protein
MEFENTQSDERILALEIRPRVTGFVAIEPPSHLLEWGRRKHRAKGDDLARSVAPKITALLDLSKPFIIVVRARNVRPLNARRRIRTILRVVRREAKKRSIGLHTISAKEVHRFFDPHEHASKHQIAQIIAGWFPELSWKLPPKRKVWKSEDHRMVIFDAIATALAFLNKSPPEQN